KLMAAAGESVLKRFGVRFGVGATQGTLLSAAMQPLTAYAHTQEGRDYTFAEALHNVLMGAGLFGLLHSVGGAGVDVVRRWRGRPLYPFDFQEPHDIFPSSDPLGGDAREAAPPAAWQTRVPPFIPGRSPGDRAEAGPRGRFPGEPIDAPERAEVPEPPIGLSPLAAAETVREEM